MPEKVCPGPVKSTACVKEAVCIHTRKIYDSCRVKECMQDVRVYLTRASQEIFERAVSVRPRAASLLWTYVDVEPVPYNRGFYNLSARFFCRVTADAFCGAGRPYELSGVCSYEVRAILFGGEGSVRSFSSMTAATATSRSCPRRCAAASTMSCCWATTPGGSTPPWGSSPSSAWNATASC